MEQPVSCFIPAQDWFYIRDWENGSETEIKHVVCWGETRGGLVGYVAERSPTSGVPTVKQIALGGLYVHRDMLNERQREAVNSGKTSYQRR